MLVISRKPGERFRIGPSTWITVLESRYDKVRIGIDAPSDVSIQREELLPHHEQYPHGPKEEKPGAQAS